MIKSKLVKVLMLGLCMSALTTGAAFAQSVAATAPVARGEVQSEELNALYAKQKEIDEAVFGNYVKAIQEKGFMINYTGVADKYVEIGISPYTDENANYLYELFGKDIVQVVKYDESVMYATSVGSTDPVAPDYNVVDVDGQPQKEEIYTTMEASPNVSVDNSDVVEPALDDKVYKGGEAGTTTGTATEANPEVIYYATDADADQEDANVQLASASEAFDAVKRGAEDTSGVSAPMMVLIIAGGAALIGGTIIISGKKKSVK